MLKLLKTKGVKIDVRGSCMDARGIKAEMLAESWHRSSMDELTAWTEAAEETFIF